MTFLRCALFAVFILSAAKLPAQTPGSGPAAGNARLRAHELFVLTSTQFLKDMNRTHAAEGYRRVVQLDPGYAPAWFNLGVLAEADGNWRDATTHFAHYLSAAPGGPYAQKAVRELSLLAQRAASPVDSAQQRYDTAIRIGRAFLSASLPARALAQAQDAQKIDPSRWDAYALASASLISLGRNEEASAMGNTALQRAPADKASFLRSWLLDYKKKADGAFQLANAPAPPPPVTAPPPPPPPSVAVAATEPAAPIPPPSALPPAPPTPGPSPQSTAVLHLYRPRHFGASGASPAFYVDGKALTIVNNGALLTLQIEAGSHVFAFGDAGAYNGNQTAALIAQPGQEYWVRARVLAGGWKANVELTPVAQAVGESESKGLKPEQPQSPDAAPARTRKK